MQTRIEIYSTHHYVMHVTRLDRNQVILKAVALNTTNHCYS